MDKTTSILYSPGIHNKIISQMHAFFRYWITQRRCEKTLQHLPATAYERLPLLHHPDHPISKIGKHRMYVQLHRHPNVVLVNIHCKLPFHLHYVGFL